MHYFVPLFHYSWLPLLFMSVIQVLELRAVREAEVFVELAQELERKALSFETEVGITVSS